MPNYVMTTTGRRDVGKYDERVHEVAFEMWWLECDRDPNKVAALLKDDPIWREMAGFGPDDIGPSDDSIRRWSVSEDWPEIAHRRMREQAPYMLEKGAVALVYGSNDAVNTILRLSKGAAAGEKFTVSERVSLDAAKEVISLVYGDTLMQLSRPTVDHAVDFDNLSTMKEIMEAEREITG